MAYATTTDVTDLLPAKTITETSKPSTGSISKWIAEAEAEVDGYLARAGIAVPMSAARGLLVLRGKVAACVTARTKHALADGTPVNHENLRQEAEKLRAEWDAFLLELKSDPTGMATMLGVGGGSSSGSAASSYWTHPPAGETPPGPKFKVEDHW